MPQASAREVAFFDDVFEEIFTGDFVLVFDAFCRFGDRMLVVDFVLFFQLCYRHEKRQEQRDDRYVLSELDKIKFADVVDNGRDPRVCGTSLYGIKGLAECQFSGNIEGKPSECLGDVNAESICS